MRSTSVGDIATTTREHVTVSFFDTTVVRPPSHCRTSDTGEPRTTLPDGSCRAMVSEIFQVPSTTRDSCAPPSTEIGSSKPPAVLKRLSMKSREFWCGFWQVTNVKAMPTSQRASASSMFWSIQSPNVTRSHSAAFGASQGRPTGTVAAMAVSVASAWAKSASAAGECIGGMAPV